MFRWTATALGSANRNPFKPRFKTGMKRNVPISPFDPEASMRKEQQHFDEKEAFVKAKHGQTSADAMPRLPKLRCPGGPRMSQLDIRMAHKVPSNGYLKQDDLRFLLNLKLTHLMMRYLSRFKREDRLYVELGPGPGALSRSLLTRPGMGVFGIEIDQRWRPELEAISQDTDRKFQFQIADILEVDEAALITQQYGAQVPPVIDAVDQSLSETEPGLHRRLTRRVEQQWQNAGSTQVEVVANLPFEIASHLIRRYAVDCGRKEGLFRFGRVPIHMFFQQGLAERVAAVPGTYDYGKLSIVVQNFFIVKVRGTFLERTYFPVTEVTGALVTFEPRVDPLVDVDAVSLSAFVDIILSEDARKNPLHHSLTLCMPEEVARYVLSEVKIDPTITCLNLTVTDIAKMALIWKRFLEATGQPTPHEKEYDATVESMLSREEHVAAHDFGREDYDRTRQKATESEPHEETVGSSATADDSGEGTSSSSKEEEEGGGDDVVDAALQRAEQTRGVTW